MLKKRLVYWVLWYKVQYQSIKVLEFQPGELGLQQKLEPRYIVLVKFRVIWGDGQMGKTHCQLRSKLWALGNLLIRCGICTKTEGDRVGPAGQNSNFITLWFNWTYPWTILRVWACCNIAGIWQPCITYGKDDMKLHLVWWCNNFMCCSSEEKRENGPF
jgi:hypothetical protein